MSAVECLCCPKTARGFECTVQPDGPRCPVFAIVGNPNCGKSTIFNMLTGLKQKVANYPGVTVEKREGTCMSQHGKRLRLLDLPGAYSLNARSPDEAVVRDVLVRSAH